MAAVTSANARITYTSAIQMKTSIASHARGPRFTLAISAMERPPWRTEATSAEKSCTAPISTTPRPIQRSAGNHPKRRQAAMGPTIGPAAAMALKCWPRR